MVIWGRGGGTPPSLYLLGFRKYKSIPDKINLSFKNSGIFHNLLLHYFQDTIAYLGHPED